MSEIETESLQDMHAELFSYMLQKLAIADISSEEFYFGIQDYFKWNGGKWRWNGGGWWMKDREEQLHTSPISEFFELSDSDSCDYEQLSDWSI